MAPETGASRHRLGLACPLCSPRVPQREAEIHQDRGQRSGRTVAGGCPRGARAVAGRRDTELLFPSSRGGYFDLHNFRAREWRPAQIAAGIAPLRRIYDLRHTFATFALRSGISTFDLSRYMGASLTMIDRHYGHLARDGRDHAIRLLDAYNRSGDAASTRWSPHFRGDRTVMVYRGRSCRRAVPGRSTARHTMWGGSRGKLVGSHLPISRSITDEPAPVSRHLRP